MAYVITVALSVAFRGETDAGQSSASAFARSSTTRSSHVQYGDTIGVSMKPGAMALARMPYSPSSAAAVLVRCMTAALVSPYTEMVGAGTSPPADAMLMIEPRPLGVIARAAAAMPQYTPM